MKPKCKLIGEDGNVFAIIGKVSKVLRQNDMTKEAIDFRAKAMNSKSYDEVLIFVNEYVDVE